MSPKRVGFLIYPAMQALDLRPAGSRAGFCRTIRGLRCRRRSPRPPGLRSPHGGAEPRASDSPQWTECKPHSRRRRRAHCRSGGSARGLWHPPRDAQSCDAGSSSCRKCGCKNNAFRLHRIIVVCESRAVDRVGSDNPCGCNGQVARARNSGAAGCAGGGQWSCHHLKRNQRRDRHGAARCRPPAWSGCGRGDGSLYAV